MDACQSFQRSRPASVVRKSCSRSRIGFTRQPCASLSRSVPWRDAFFCRGPRPSIRIDALWLCTQPLDMRAGAERLMAHVVHALGSARADHGYLFANARATRIKLLVHGGFGVRCAARRLNVGRCQMKIRAGVGLVGSPAPRFLLW